MRYLPILGVIPIRYLPIIGWILSIVLVLSAVLVSAESRDTVLFPSSVSVGPGTIVSGNVIDVRYNDNTFLNTTDVRVASSQIFVQTIVPNSGPNSGWKQNSALCIGTNEYVCTNELVADANTTYISATVGSEVVEYTLGNLAFLESEIWSIEKVRLNLNVRKNTSALEAYSSYLRFVDGIVVYSCIGLAPELTLAFASYQVEYTDPPVDCQGAPNWNYSRVNNLTISHERFGGSATTTVTLGNAIVNGTNAAFRTVETYQFNEVGNANRLTLDCSDGVQDYDLQILRNVTSWTTLSSNGCGAGTVSYTLIPSLDKGTVYVRFIDATNDLTVGTLSVDRFVLFYTSVVVESWPISLCWLFAMAAVLVLACILVARKRFGRRI